MRARPSAALALLIYAGYLAVVFTVWVVVDVDYDTVSDTVENVRSGIVLAIGLGAAYLAVVTTALGWWRPALREPHRAGSRWMFAVPVLLAVGALANLATTRWGDITDVGSYVATLALGTAFVGFSEEMLTRGLVIVGLRGTLHERWVWVVSGLLFGLLHVPNAAFGQGGAETAQQVVFAFLVGTAYYLTRRITGALIVTMVLHFLWDFALFVHEASTDAVAPGAPLLYLGVALALVALWRVIKEGDVVAPGGDQLAAFEGRPASAAPSSTPQVGA